MDSKVNDLKRLMDVQDAFMQRRCLRKRYRCTVAVGVTLLCLGTVLASEIGVEKLGQMSQLVGGMAILGGLIVCVYGFIQYQIATNQ